MGYQIIREPGTDRFGIFDSVTDAFEAWEATHDEVIEFFVDLAASTAKERVEIVLGHVEAGNSHTVYSSRTLTWDEAVALDRDHGGDMSAELDAK